MNNRFFDFSYKVEQGEIIDKLRQKELPRNHPPARENEHTLLLQILKRI